MSLGAVWYDDGRTYDGDGGGGDGDDQDDDDVICCVVSAWYCLCDPSSPFPASAALPRASMSVYASDSPYIHVLEVVLAAKRTFLKF